MSDKANDGKFAKNLDVTMDGQKSSGKVYKLDEVKEHSTNEDMWLAVHNKVYDITKFIDEHPGGVEVLLENGGTDATYAFEDVGHSLDARDLLAQYYIGDVHEDDRTEKAVRAANGGGGESSMTVGVLASLVVGAVAAGAFYFYNRT